MKKPIFTLFLGGIFLLFSGGKSAPVSEEEIVDEFVSFQPNSGAAVAIVTADTSYSIVSGYAKPGKKVTERTIFEIGSLTKLFTAIHLAGEVQSGRIDPFAKISSQVPGLDCDTSVTWLNLATHSSGLPRLATNFWESVLNPADPYISYDEKCLTDFTSSYKIDPVKKGKYEYSNIGYAILGEALKKHGKYNSFFSMISSSVLEKLQMNSTYVNPGLSENEALGHKNGLSVLPWSFDETCQAQGALRSDISDMRKFLIANLFPGSDFLGKSITVSQKKWFSDPQSGITTGLGWHLTNYKGNKLLIHSGATAGFRSIIILIPSSSIGITFLTNSDNDPEKTALRLINKLLKTNNSL